MTSDDMPPGIADFEKNDAKNLVFTPQKGKKEVIVAEIVSTTITDLVAGVGFEPHDLRVMSPTSYRAALPRDMMAVWAVLLVRSRRLHPLVPVTGIEPVRCFRITGF